MKKCFLKNLLTFGILFSAHTTITPNIAQNVRNPSRLHPRTGSIATTKELCVSPAFEKLSAIDNALTNIQYPSEDQQRYLNMLAAYIKSSLNYLISMPQHTEGAALGGYLTSDNACNIAAKLGVIGAASYIVYCIKNQWIEARRKLIQKLQEQQQAPIRFV